jgi:HlyD family secretion protein
VRALGTGRLVRLAVTLGEKVAPNQVIGEIFQEDQRDTIRETRARLDQLRDENERLVRFENDERTAQEQAIARLRDAINRTIENAKEGLRVALRIVDGSERLRLISQLSNLDYLKDLQQKYTIQNDLNNGISRLAELELTRLTSENLRQRARLQRQLEISKLMTKLQLDRDKLERTSRIVSHTQGTVTQILTAADEYVREGAPVVLLSSPKETGPGPDDAGTPFECIVFVPAGEGKKIDVGNFVEVMPATIKREEHGFIHGKVVAVAELPATRLAMEAALQHPDLVETFLKRYAPGVLLRVHVLLTPRDGATSNAANDSDRADENRFRWSSSSGATQRLKTGTLCEAAIVVEQQRLITLVVPWLKKLMDLH